MKKIFILFALIILTTSQVFAYDENFKKSFYDGYILSFFGTLENKLSTNYPKTKVNTYMSALKGRFNRKQLENQTWPCVNALPYDKLINGSGSKCMYGWSHTFIEQNKDLMILLK